MIPIVIDIKWTSQNKSDDWQGPLDDYWQISTIVNDEEWLRVIYAWEWLPALVGEWLQLGRTHQITSRAFQPTTATKTRHLFRAKDGCTQCFACASHAATPCGTCVGLVAFGRLQGGILGSIPEDTNGIGILSLLMIVVSILFYDDSIPRSSGILIGSLFNHLGL